MSALDREFTATLVTSPDPAGWTYVVMPGSADFCAGPSARAQATG